MAIIYAGTNDSWRRITDSSSWSNARGDVSSSAGAGTTSGSYYNFAVYNRYVGGRGGNNYYCSRVFLEFDLSGESGTASSVDLKIYSDNLGTDATNEKTVYAVQATALADSNDDFGNIFSSGTTLGTLLGSAEISTTLGYHSITLNTAGVSAVNSAIGSGSLIIGVMGYYDYNNSTPSLGGNYGQQQVYFSDYTGTSRDPKLDITYAAATAEDNATFFGTNF